MFAWLLKSLQKKRLLKKSVAELKLSPRPVNVLQRNGIKTIGELIEKSEMDLLRMKNFGRRSIKEICEALETVGLALRKEL